MGRTRPRDEDAYRRRGDVLLKVITRKQVIARDAKDEGFDTPGSDEGFDTPGSDEGFDTLGSRERFLTRRG